MPKNMKLASTKYNPSPHVILNLHRFTLFVACCIILFGIIGVLGWVLNIQQFRLAFPNTSYIKLNTFLYLISAGVVLAILRLNLEGRRQLRLIALPMLASMLILVLTFTQAISDASANIDLISPHVLQVEALFSSDALVLGSPISMLLMTLAFWMIIFDTMHWLRQAFAFTVILIGFTTIITYLYSYQWQHTLWVYRDMTLPIALSFALVSVCLFMIRPKTELMHIVVDTGVGGILLRRMLLTITVAPVIVGFLVIIGERLEIYDMVIAIVLLVIVLVIFFVFVLIANVSAIHDIYQSHLNIAEQNRFQATMLQNVSDAVIASDNNLHITGWNQAAEKIYGWRAEEVIGKTIREILAIEVIDGITTAESRNILVSKGNWTGETLQKRRDGSKIYIYTSTSSIVDETGTHIGYVAVNRDITEYKRMQEETYKAELEQIAIRAERETIKMREGFIATVSHDFRTPISIIVSSSDFLMQLGNKLNADNSQNRLMKIRAQGFYMGKLLDDVLDYSRVRAGKLNITASRIDVEEFTRHLFEEVQLTDQSNLHTFVFEAVGELSGATLDTIVLQRILTNLLSNAIKYSPTRGEIKLTVRRDGDKLFFCVSDQGIGIPEQDIKQLFEPFHRADNAHYVEGMGLGMAIVKEHIKLCHGEIYVQSAIGEGTTFTVEIPYRMEKNTY